VEARVADARAYIDRALQLRPDEPAVLDTAAEVYSVQGDLEGALGFVDRALAAATAAKTPSYTVHKAEILLRGEREDEAKALLEGVRAKYRGDAASEQARSLLWQIEHKHLPEEEPGPPPEAPEDEENSPGNGGGE
jgi:predicted Zn-dependent protease